MKGDVIWLDAPEARRIEVAGGKGASLANMMGAGLPVPPGFVIRAGSLPDSLAESGREAEVRRLLAQIDSDDAAWPIAEQVQTLVGESPPPEALAHEIRRAYGDLGDDEPPVAVRSSVPADGASYAGQEETFLNVRGGEAVLESVRNCWVSFFAERALFYRRRRGSLENLGMAVVVQRQLAPDKAGVLFTTDPVRRRHDQMLVEGAWGLGEAVVSGRVIPDHYVIARDGHLKRSLVSRQDIAVVRDAQGGTVEVPLEEKQATSQVLTEEELERLAGFGRRLEELFGTPQDIEWAIEEGDIYLLQSRPITA